MSGRLQEKISLKLLKVEKLDTFVDQYVPRPLDPFSWSDISAPTTCWRFPVNYEIVEVTPFITPLSSFRDVKAINTVPKRASIGRSSNTPKAPLDWPVLLTVVVVPASFSMSSYSENFNGTRSKKRNVSRENFQKNAVTHQPRIFSLFKPHFWLFVEKFNLKWVVAN